MWVKYKMHKLLSHKQNTDNEPIITSAKAVREGGIVPSQKEILLFDLFPQEVEKDEYLHVLSEKKSITVLKLENK